MTKTKTSEFVAYINSKEGNAYLWGGQGESLYDLARELAKKNGQADEKTEKMLAQMEKQGVRNIEFFDCSGLGVSFLLEKGAISCDMTANGLYQKCKKIEKEDSRAGDMVFLVNSSGKATHIGYLVNRTTVVHAFNQSKGVIKENVDKRAWKFGRPNFCMEYDLEEEKKVDVQTLNIGNKVTIAASLLGYNTAANALAAVNPVVTYPAGSYYIYKVCGQAVNITKKKGAAGAWVVL